MEFVLAFQESPSIHDIHADPVKGQQVSFAWKQYMGAMAAAGVMRGGTQLDPRNASTVRVRDGQRHIQNGPTPDRHAQFSGFVVINVETLEQALYWAELSPSASTGHTEVIPAVPSSRA